MLKLNRRHPPHQTERENTEEKVSLGCGTRSANKLRPRRLAVITQQVFFQGRDEEKPKRGWTQNDTKAI